MSKGRRYANLNMTKKSNNDTKRKKRKVKKNSEIPKYQKILLIIFIITFIVSSFVLVKWYYNTSKAEEKYQELSTEVTKIEEEKTNIDFEKLKNINKDVVGWIKIDNTTIDYPIMKSNNNEYYLRKDIYNEYEQCGSIFLDYKNDSNFTDKNIVVYGHHIKKGIMFADLIKIYNGSLGNDVDINIYTPKKTMRFKVFASYETEPEDYSINTNIKENDYKEFTNTLKQRSDKDFVGEVEYSNQIITLSTCDSSGAKRILVHGVLEEIK